MKLCSDDLKNEKHFQFATQQGSYVGTAPWELQKYHSEAFLQRLVRRAEAADRFAAQHGPVKIIVKDGKRV